MSQDHNITPTPSARTMYSSGRQARSLIEAVCLRPQMYTIGGTLEEVGAFLEGFYSGLTAHNRDKDAVEVAQEWFTFCKWANNHFNESSEETWYTLFVNLREKYSHDSDALNKLLLLFIEYTDSK